MAWCISYKVKSRRWFFREAFSSVGILWCCVACSAPQLRPRTWRRTSCNPEDWHLTLLMVPTSWYFLGSFLINVRVAWCWTGFWSRRPLKSASSGVWSLLLMVHTPLYHNNTLEKSSWSLGDDLVPQDHQGSEVTNDPIYLQSDPGVFIRTSPSWAAIFQEDSVLGILTPMPVSEKKMISVHISFFTWEWDLLMFSFAV